jgi:hypothetical protein
VTTLHGPHQAAQKWTSVTLPGTGASARPPLAIANGAKHKIKHASAFISGVSMTLKPSESEQIIDQGNL